MFDFLAKLTAPFRRWQAARQRKRQRKAAETALAEKARQKKEGRRHRAQDRQLLPPRDLPTPAGPVIDASEPPATTGGQAATDEAVEQPAAPAIDASGLPTEATSTIGPSEMPGDMAAALPPPEMPADTTGSTVAPAEPELPKLQPSDTPQGEIPEGPAWTPEPPALPPLPSQAAQEPSGAIPGDDGKGIKLEPSPVPELRTEVSPPKMPPSAEEVPVGSLDHLIPPVDAGAEVPVHAAEIEEARRRRETRGSRSRKPSPEVQTAEQAGVGPPPPPGVPGEVTDETFESPDDIELGQQQVRERASATAASRREEKKARRQEAAAASESTVPAQQGPATGMSVYPDEILRQPGRPSGDTTDSGRGDQEEIRRKVDELKASVANMTTMLEAMREEMKNLGTVV